MIRTPQIITTIELQDNFTGSLYAIIDSVNLWISAMEDLHETMNTLFDTAPIDAVRDSINQTIIAVRELNEAMQGMENPAAETPTASKNSAAPSAEPDINDPLAARSSAANLHVGQGQREPVGDSANWQSDIFEVFTSTGVERFEQEVRSANSMLNTLNESQQRINEQAADMDFLPPGGFADLTNMQDRLQAIRQRIQAIENNPVNIGTDTANAELEELRRQLAQAVQVQEELNRAVDNMDVQAANEAYLRLSQTVGNTEIYIRDNVDEQGRFNREIEQGESHSGRLMDFIKGIISDYATLETAGKVMELSDTMTQMSARLSLIVDDGGSVEELQNKIFESAQASRGSYLATAEAVSELGIQASQAFSSNDELIAFTELLNKQFVNAGTSEEGIDSVMSLLTQSMAEGGLNDGELDTVIGNAPAIVQDIQRYLQEVKGMDAGNIKELASEGIITADVIKNAMFYAADETNAKFESMPMTFGQIWQSFQNGALMSFQPVLQKINEIANSEAFQTFIDKAMGLMAGLATVVSTIFDVIMQIGTWIADNWSMISPIVYGVIGALAAYVAYMAIIKIAETIGAAIKIAMCLASYAYAAATRKEASANAIATASQYGLNQAMLSSPLTWIIVLIMALIAVVIAVANHIANMGGTATTAFGVICGGVNVVIQFFKNLGLMVANIALGIGNAIAAVASNIMTAFHNAICSVQAWWYDLLSTVLDVVAEICKALNKLPFVEFDYSGITSAAHDYAEKSAEADRNKKDYQSISDAFNEGMNTFDAFGDGWVSDAYEAGAAWGDGISNKVSDMFTEPDTTDYTKGLDESMTNAANNSGITDRLDDISGDISDSMDIAEEDLKYLRDIAEQEAVNRFTTAEINIDQSGMKNTIKNGMDLDGVVNGLTDAVNEAVNIIAEGVHG